MNVNIIFKGFNQVTRNEIPHCVNLIIYHFVFLCFGVCLCMCVFPHTYILSNKLDYRCFEASVMTLFYIHLPLHLPWVSGFKIIFIARIIIMDQNFWQVLHNEKDVNNTLILTCIKLKTGY